MALTVLSTVAIAGNKVRPLPSLSALHKGSMVERILTLVAGHLCFTAARRTLFWCMVLTLHGTVRAQLDIPVPLSFTSDAPADRQIGGLADPLSPDAAVSANAARSMAMNRTIVQGSASMTGSLTPPLDAYSIGLSITVLPTEVNQQAATLDLDGLGARFIVKNGDQVLDSADLRPGIPVRLIYDGTYFQLLNRTYLTCPTGFSVVNGSYCIGDLPLATNSFFGAASACAAMNARLCTINEWAYACRSIPGFLGTVITAEWVDDAANNTDGAKLLGAGNNGEIDLPGTSCTFGTQNSPYNLFRARCCANR